MRSDICQTRQLSSQCNRLSLGEQLNSGRMTCVATDGGRGARWLTRRTSHVSRHAVARSPRVYLYSHPTGAVRLDTTHDATGHPRTARPHRTLGKLDAPVGHVGLLGELLLVAGELPCDVSEFGTRTARCTRGLRVGRGERGERCEQGVRAGSCV